VKRSVFDASAIITFLHNRPGAEIIEALLHGASGDREELFLSVVNWGEIYYTTWRANGAKAAEQVAFEVKEMPIRILDVGVELTRIASQFRAEYKLPYADCFVAAVAKSMNAEIVTADQDFLLVNQELSVTFV
jgi:predicted nucleic acid-binding protein